MAWYTSTDNCINRLPLPETSCRRIQNGYNEVVAALADALIEQTNSAGRPVLAALDGFKGVAFRSFTDALAGRLTAAGVEVQCYNVNQVFRTPAEINDIAEPFDRPADPSFGRVFDGTIEQLVDPERVRQQAAHWEQLRSTKGRRVVLCYGVGAALPGWRHCFDRIAYLDITREQIGRLADRNELNPVGSDTPNGFPWKRIYYFEYPLLNRHKKDVLRRIDWYIDFAQTNDPKLVPAEVYHAMIAAIAERPISFKVFYMPGMFGGTEFGKRFKVHGLPNTSWDYEISVGDNHLLVDPGDGRILELPFYNVIFEQPLRLLGNYSSRTYPDHFPIAIYMQDGYFPPESKEGFKRTHMPNHLHPDTAYCREHFNEPLGRYETYYIVRADPGACTMHGFKDDADIDAYIQDVLKSSETNTEFDWRKYIHEHPSRTGELHQLPPGTVHGTGGRQIILEIDTNPSRESTEYSFYLYDYCRPTFNYQKNDFTGKPLKLTLEHSLAILRRNRKQRFMAANARPEPVCIRQGADWREMSFPMYYNMPYQINRLEFATSVEDDTGGLFHCLALTQGTRVRVRSLSDPDRQFVMEDCDNIVLPACFGPYVCENLGKGPCQVIKTFLITEPRDQIDQTQEEKDWPEGQWAAPQSLSEEKR
jgi:hypothetical protein